MDHIICAKIYNINGHINSIKPPVGRAAHTYFELINWSRFSVRNLHYFENIEKLKMSEIQRESEIKKLIQDQVRLFNS